MIDSGKKSVLGVEVNSIDYEAAVERITAAARAGRSCSVSALAVHGVMTGALDPEHRHRLNKLDIVTPDGQPVRWALNLLHHLRLKDRVYGPTLTLKVCERAAHEGLPLYFYGSRQDIVEKLGDRVRELYPEVNIVGTRASLFRRMTTDERDQLVREVAASGAKILFVGLGCPRQEVFAYEMGARMGIPILAVGAAFDYHSGALREPPAILQRVGLHWFYRLLQEPRRLWRRYLYYNTSFVLLVVLQWLRLRPAHLADADAPSVDLLYG